MLKYSDIMALEGTWINPIDSSSGCHSLTKTEKETLKLGLDFIDTFSFKVLERLRKNPIYDISYNHETDRLQLPIPERFKTVEHYLISIFHEYGHATGHSKRLGRLSLLHAIGRYSKLNRLEEITVELIALKLGQILKLNYDWLNCYLYIKTYLQDYHDDKLLLKAAEQQASIAVKYLLNKKEINK